MKSDFVGHDERVAVVAGQHRIGRVVVDELLALDVELQDGPDATLDPVELEAGGVF